MRCLPCSRSRVAFSLTVPLFTVSATTRCETLNHAPNASRWRADGVTKRCRSGSETAISRNAAMSVPVGYSLTRNMEVEDPVVLDFHDSLLRKSDAELLNDGGWLNDKLIGFMFEYFEYEQFKDLNDVLFVNPDVVQCIKLSRGSDLSIFLDPLHVETKNTMLFPVNNQENPNATGGSHWSLLAYDRLKNTFEHYDSATSFNTQQAKKICEVLQPFLSGEKKPDFTEAKCPQQINSYDCGVYVICFSECICEQRRQRKTPNDFGNLSPSSVNKKREEIRLLIKQLHNHMN